jgi:N-ethylmaleimide reductase
MNSPLHNPITVGQLQLAHRVVLAPMTRLRAEPDDSPSDMMIDYYRQRASPGGLLITESAHPSTTSRGYLGAPGLYTDRHVDRWKLIVDAVHDRGGVIVAQIAHDGRQSHVSLSGGELPIAPSVVPFDTQVFTADGWVPNSHHRAVGRDEIPSLVDSFRRAATRAADAGFDGIELHAANGYLVDTFLQDGTNQRTDDYGGDIAGRARFPLQLVGAFIDVFGADRVGVRVSPSGTWGSISDSNPESTFGFFADRLTELHIAYLHVIEPRVSGTETVAEGRAAVAAAALRRHFHGPIIAAGGFDRAGAEDILHRGDADLVAFGRLFASNPDLPERLRNGWPLDPYDRETFWGGTEYHYSDYLPYGDAQSV